MTTPIAQNTPSRLPIRGPVVFGILVIALFFGGAGAWAMLTELSSAAVAPGVISVESNRKTVKHLEGGIIGEILVKEGDRINAGDVLFRLDHTQSKARLDLLAGRTAVAEARAARLKAERDGHTAITFPSFLASAPAGSSPAQARDGEMTIFRSRSKAMSGQIKVLNQQIAAFQAEIKGLEGQIKAQKEQLDLINEEIRDQKKMFKKGLALKSNILIQRRQAADMQGKRSQNVAAIARIRQSIIETTIRIQELAVQQRNNVVEELGSVQAELFDLAEQRRAAEDVLRRTEISAPIDGTVVELKVHTEGGVITPGEPLLDIVPLGERLLVDARVNPLDIDVVFPGLEAEIRFTAFNQRNRLPVQGRVVSVSADRLTDEATGEAYFLARVEPDQASLHVLDGVDLKPGMQADVFILTGARSPIDYLTAPIARSLEKAMREN